MSGIISSSCDYSCKGFEKSKRLFSYIEFDKTIIIGNEKPGVEQIISTLTDPEIISVKLIDSISGHSQDGEHATGKKAVIRLKIKEKILYTSNNGFQTIHVIEKNFYHSTFIIIPRNIEGTDTNLLLKNNRLKFTVKVEDTNTRIIAMDKIYKYICFSLEMLLIPTFELCYSIQEHKSNGNLFISFENGSFSTKLTELENSYDSKPVWSPNGENIAFITHDHDSNLLCIVNIKNLSKTVITDPAIFKNISSYCWALNGTKLIFASIFNGIKDLFIANTQDGNWEQLTYGNSSVRHYMPRCSLDNRYIGFLKNVSSVVNLYIQDIGGQNCKQITSSGHIKDFNWSADSSSIAIIRDTNGNPDEILIVDINTLNEKLISLCKCANRKRNIKFSPDNNYITVIGTAYDIDDIYLIDIKNYKALNLTKNPAGISISSYCWNADSNKIFYSSNNNTYFNIYFYSIINNSKHQITNTKSSGINLCYRPKIN